MSVYRVYVLDADGHVCAPARIVECDNDQEAIQQARKFVTDGVVEIWLDTRFIVRLEPGA